MYRDKHKKDCGKSGRKTQVGALALSILLLVTLAIGGTVAYLFTKSGSAENTFTPSNVACEVTETFDGATKSNVKIKNTGNTDAYIRAMIIVTWKDTSGNVYGKQPVADDYTISINNENWTLIGRYYYYNFFVGSGEQTANLISSCTQEAANCPDGYTLSVEIIADAIQALGTDSNGNTPTQLVWGVTIKNGSVTALPEP